MDILPQLIVNGVIVGAIYASIALGLTLCYGVLSFVNFAHGDIAAVGAYSLLYFKIMLGWPLIPSILASITVVILLGLLIERLAFRPVQNAPKMTPLLIAIGISFLLQAIIQLIFGANVYALYESGTIAKGYSIFGDKAIITKTQLLIIATNITLFTSLFFFLKKTKLGKAVRAVSDNKEMAKILGIPTNTIIAFIFGLSSAFAAISGMLIGYEQNLQPNMGIILTVKAFAAIILGGIGHLFGAVVGGLLIGLAENLIVGIQIGNFSIPSGYKDAVGFIVFIIVIFVRPYGLFGSKTEITKK